MPQISTYPIISIPALDDLLIGTDVNNFEETKNFRLGDVFSLVGGNFVPYTGATGNINLGSFGISGSSFVKIGGTNLQFLKADGSVDSTAYTPQARTITINGVTYDLSGDRSWNIGAVESLSTAGTEGASTLNEGVLNIPQYQPSGNYITQLSGEATGSGPGAAAVVLSNSAVISKVLTGFNTISGVISASDSILQALGKAQSQINALTSGVSFRGVWNASTNTPTLTSGSGTGGHYYVVSVSGTTNLNGNASWSIGDWVIFNGTSSVWQRVPSGQLVSSVNGYTGAVSLNSADTGSAPTTRTLTINGTAFNLSADRAWTVGNLRSDSTYANPSWLTSLDWAKITGRPSTLAGYGITDGLYSTTTITINGVGYDLSANRTWSVGTVKSVSVSGPLTGGTITNAGTIGINQSSSTTDGYLSAADWNMFNDKLASISATAPISFTLGVISISQAGASSSGYLSQADWNAFNNKQGLITNPITGSGTSGKLPIFTSSGEIGDSILSYSANSLLFSYNSTIGNSLVLTNSGIGSYSYSVLMDNYSIQRSTTHQYSPGNIIEAIGDNQVRRVFENGNTVLGVQTVDNGNKLSIYGTLFVNNVDNSTISTNKFLVHDSGVVKFRTASQVFSEIGATRQITINGVAQDLSADRSWSVGTVTSVSLSAPVGFAVSGSPVTGSGSLSLAFASGYSLPTVSSQASWDSAFANTIVSAAVAGTTTKTLTLTQQDGGTVTASWTESGGGGTPGGSNTQIQFNNSGAFGGSANLTWNGTNSILTVASSNGVVQQLNGLATSNAYIDFQNAGTTQWRVGNDYNGGSRLFRINDVAGSVNTMLVNSSNQIGFNMPTTSFLGSNSAFEFHKTTSQFISRQFAYSSSGLGVQNESRSTRSNTYGSYSATLSGDPIYAYVAYGSTNSAYAYAGLFGYYQNGSTVTYVPGYWTISASGGSTADRTKFNVDGGNDRIEFFTTSTERMRLTSSGRLLLNPTSDNGVDQLQVSGSAIASTLKVNTSGQTATISTYYNGGTGNNIWIGGGGLSSTSTSFSNSSFGRNALLNNTGGSNNTAIGNDALRTNTTGNFNTAIGDEALYSNTSGFANDAFGLQALRNVTTGYRNVGFGSVSAHYTTTGYENMAIGHLSLLENTTGYRNIAIGVEAGRRISGGGANQTSNSSIYIGTDTRSSANGNTNEIVIGNLNIGQGSNSVTLGNSSITQTLLRGAVTGGSFIVSGGTASQFLKADGTVDSSTYLTANQSITLSGDVTGSGATAITTTIGNNTVSLAKMAQVSTARILGRVTAATGNVEALTGTQLTTLVDVFTSTLKGLVPAPGAVGSTKFLREDGTWVVPSGGGGGITGSGTANYMPKFTSGTVVGDSSIIDTANQTYIRSGINSSSPPFPFSFTSSYKTMIGGGSGFNLSIGNSGGFWLQLDSRTDSGALAPLAIQAGQAVTITAVGNTVGDMGFNVFGTSVALIKSIINNVITFQVGGSLVESFVPIQATSFYKSGATSSDVLYGDGSTKKITSGTAAPSGGSDGDIYLQYV